MFGPHSSANNYLYGEISVHITTILNWTTHFACRRLLETCFCFHHLLKVMLQNLLLWACYVEIMSIAIHDFYYYLEVTTEHSPFRNAICIKYVPRQ